MLGIVASNAQYLLQAPNSGDENNYRWYNATETNTVLSTDFFLEVNQQGVYFAVYDGTLCGKNATGYFIVTNCNSPHNEVNMDIRANVPSGATVNWSPAVTGDQTNPSVIATQTVVRYTPNLTKAGHDFRLPNFTIVCINEAATLVDDVVTTNEDVLIDIDIFTNDSDMPTTGILTTTNPTNGTVTINDNGTPNDPNDDIVTYIPNPDYNGPDSFDYTICSTFGDCSTATVDITVLPIVDAIDDVVSTTEDTPITIDVLGNDNDIPTIGTFTVTNPSNGTIIVDDNGTPNDSSDDSVTYTPNNNYTGTDTFEYTICDDLGNCSTATVSVIVTDSLIVDSDNDGILDSFEDLNLDGDDNPSTNSTDTDGDGYPDYLDIDSDNDGVPDNVEAQTTADYIAPSGIDANANGLDDAYEGSTIGIFPVDTDGDSLPDYLDEDSDNDNVPDSIEAHDYDHDGIPDVVLIGSDKDDDGLDDGYEGVESIDIDINDEINAPFDNLPNTDGDSESDYRDTDDDNDGIETAAEDLNLDGDYANDDSNVNGIPEYLELNASDDEIEVFNILTPNGDGVHDVLTITGLENFPENTLKVFNRWGVLVYSTSAYNTEGNVFDGTSNGRVTIDTDKMLPVGTYFYILDYKNNLGEDKSLSGYLYINR